MLIKNVGWSKANKKASFFDKTVPESLWITIFLIILIILALVWANSAKFEPLAVKAVEIVELSPKAEITPSALKMTATGVASWYDYSLDDDTPGNEWSKSHDTCATRGWNRYGKMKATNLENGKSVVCYVNDHGPMSCEDRYKYKIDEPGTCIERLVDMSSHAFEQIADKGLGLINVSIEEVN